MRSVREFLTRDFLPQQGRSREPDGRLLHLYKCEDREFWQLVELLREAGPPSGHDFDQYRTRWQTLREELQNTRRQHPFSTHDATDLEWLIRGFVLYASEFWLRFRNDEWRGRSFPDGLPFRKLTWLQFLSLVDWTDLYHEEIAGYVELESTRYRVAHTNTHYAKDFSDSEWDGAGDDGSHRNSKRRMPDRGHYPGLYIPMLAAWKWWKVAHVRLPSSIRYLDTFALQGGAADRLVIECTYAYDTASEIVYGPVNPPHGYGITALPIEKKSLPPDANDPELHVTLVFGTGNNFSEV